MRFARTPLIAVPQAPAPRTATFTLGTGDLDVPAAALPPWVSLLPLRVASLLRLQSLHIQRLERERREQHRREACAHHEVGDRLAQVRKEDRRAGDAEQRVELLRRHVAHGEDAGL